MYGKLAAAVLIVLIVVCLAPLITSFYQRGRRYIRRQWEDAKSIEREE